MEASLRTILEQAIQSKASDIHFIPSRAHVQLKFRVMGDIEIKEQLDFTFFQKLMTYVKYICKLDVSERNQAQSGVVTYFINNQEFQLRASTLPQSQSIEALVIRIIPAKFQALPMQNHLLYDLVKSSSGLILISGPTGSGKSTLMYSLLEYAIHHFNRQVITIEDPVEQYLEGAIQINVNTKANITYKNSLKAILRCDPDIIMIGEIRDQDTAKQAISASLSGHLVIATIHATNAIGVIERLKEMDVTEQELMQTTHSIINQRLIKMSHQRELVYEILYQQDIIQHLQKHSLNYIRLQDQITDLYRKGKISKNEYDKHVFEKPILSIPS